MAWEIRLATPADADRMAAMHIATWRAAYRDILAPGLLESLSVEARADRWRGILGDPENPRRTYLAFEADEVVGFTSAGPCRDDDLAGAGAFEVVAIYVRPDRWGAGLARALFDHLGPALAAAPLATIWVLEENGRARRFYEKLGFRPDGARHVREKSGYPMPCIRMRRAAGAPPPPPPPRPGG